MNFEKQYKIFLKDNDKNIGELGYFANLVNLGSSNGYNWSVEILNKNVVKELLVGNIKAKKTMDIIFVFDDKSFIYFKESTILIFDESNSLEYKIVFSPEEISFGNKMPIASYLYM